MGITSLGTRSLPTMTCLSSTTTTGPDQLLSLGASHGPFISIPTIRAEPCVFSQVTQVYAHGDFTQLQVTLDHLREMCPVQEGVVMQRKKFTLSILVSSLVQDLRRVSSHLINNNIHSFIVKDVFIIWYLLVLIIISINN